MTTNPQLLSQDDLDGLIERVISRSPTDQRYLLGITGPPGAGKSTVAERVAAAVGDTACVAPMDGFHRSNEDLAAAGLLPLKGIPETFDAEAFVAHVEQLHAAERVTWPTFDRSREVVVPAGLSIDPSHQLVIVEGNYLLLTSAPWSRLRELLDEVWYLEVPHAELMRRLRARHELARSPSDAWAKVQSTDLPNAALVASTRDRADVIIRDD